MRSLLVVLVIVSVGCVSSTRTLRYTAATGGALVAGGTVAFLASDACEGGPCGGQALGALAAFAGLGLLVYSGMSYAVLVASTPEAAARSAPEHVACAPVANDSNVWSCGEGYRCTPSFTGCEHADGRPELVWR